MGCLGNGAGHREDLDGHVVIYDVMRRGVAKTDSRWEKILRMPADRRSAVLKGWSGKPPSSGCVDQRAHTLPSADHATESLADDE